MELQAKITNRRNQPNQNGKTVCCVTCPACKHSQVVTYGGWSALGCKCGATLTRYARGTFKDSKLEKIGGAGCIKYVKKNRSTGTETGAYDSLAQGLDSPTEVDENGKSDHIPWAAVCWTHSSLILDNRKTMVKFCASYPENFCEPCMEISEKRRV